MNKTLTISVAAYNVADYLDECLSSLCLKNNMEKLEVIVVDDGSSDSTYEKAMAFEKKYPSVFKVISKKNGGWGSTLNVAIKEATGKYFKQLDGDDFYKTDNLEKLLQVLDKVDTDVVFSPYVLYNNSTKKYETLEFKKGNEAISIDAFLDSYSGVQMHACLFKTSILQNNHVSVLEHCFYTDQEYMLKGFYFSKDVSFFNKPIYCYRVDRAGQSVSLDGYIKHRKDHEKVILELSSFFEGKSEVHPFYSERLMSLVNTQYAIYLKMGNAKDELKSFDNELKKYSYYSKFSKKFNEYKKINVLHFTKFAAYKMLSKKFEGKEYLD